MSAGRVRWWRLEQGRASRARRWCRLSVGNAVLICWCTGTGCLRTYRLEVAL